MKRTILVVLFAAGVGCLVADAIGAVTRKAPGAAYVGNGSTTRFLVPFPFLAPGDVVVTVDQVVQAPAIVGHDAVLATAPAQGAEVTVRRDTALGQPEVAPDTYDAEVASRALDRISLQLQDAERACLPARGARIQGQSCTVTEDCDPSLALVCAPGGHCASAVPACFPDGAVCSANLDCCSGTCAIDLTFTSPTGAVCGGIT